MFELLLQDWSNMLLSVEYIWILFGLIGMTSYIKINLDQKQIYFTKQYVIAPICVQYNLSSFWRPPILTWFVICRCLSENSEEDTLTTRFYF